MTNHIWVAAPCKEEILISDRLEFYCKWLEPILTCFSLQCLTLLSVLNICIAAILCLFLLTEHRQRIPLWRFLLQLLHRDSLSRLIQWTDAEQFKFKIKEPNEVAQLWGSIKDKSDMTYEKLGRAMRYYYGKNIIEKVRFHLFAEIFRGLMKNGLARVNVSTKSPKKVKVRRMDIKSSFIIPMRYLLYLRCFRKEATHLQGV